MAINNFDIVPGGVLIDGVTMAADIDLTSDGSASSTKVLIKPASDKVGIELYSASGTRAGSVEILESNTGDNWEPVTFADDSTSLTVTAATEFLEFKNLVGLCSRFLYVKFTDSTGGSGVGTLSVSACVIQG